MTNYEKDRIGVEKNDYVITKFLGIINSKRMFQAECKICGNIVVSQYSEFIRRNNKHCYIQCKENYLKSIIGKKYGDFIVIEAFSGKYVVECCICGIRKTINTNSLLHNKGLDHLYCKDENIVKDKYYKKLNCIWNSMRSRTCNPKSCNYKNYGGRGISSDYYKYFSTFYYDFIYELKEKEKETPLRWLSIDRINNNGNYEKSNLRISNPTEQARNRRTNKNIIAISPNGETYGFKVITDFAKKHNLCRSCITCCLKGKQKDHKGWKFYYK